MKQTTSKVLANMTQSRMYKKDIVQICLSAGMKRSEIKRELDELCEKGILTAYETLVDWVDYSVILYVCNYEIMKDGDTIYLSEK